MFDLTRIKKFKYCIKLTLGMSCECRPHYKNDKMKKDWIFFVLLLNVNGALSLTCYTCTQGVTNNKCNVANVTCSGSEVCYTTVLRRPVLVKRYDKGCMASYECYSWEGLNHKLTCDQYGSMCTYCCDSYLCNAFNGANKTMFFVTLYAIVLFVLFSIV